MSRFLSSAHKVLGGTVPIGQRSPLRSSARCADGIRRMDVNLDQQPGGMRFPPPDGDHPVIYKRTPRASVQQHGKNIATSPTHACVDPEFRMEA